MRRFFLAFLFLNLAAAASLRADDSIREVQTRLKAGGFYFGEVNGRYDSATAAAVTRYQIRNGLKITGKLDEQTSYALGVSAAEPKAPMPPRFGEDTWRQLRKTDQAALEKLIAAEQAKKDPKTSRPVATAQGPASAYTSERLRDYIAAFVLAGLDPQVGAETEFFAERVDYFGEKGVTKEKIRRDLERYNGRWPQRSFSLAGDLEVRAAQDRLTVSFPLRYELRSGSRHSAGKVWKTLVLEKTGADDFQIVSVNERKAD